MEVMYGAPVLGLYDSESRILYIADNIDMNTPLGASVLVHELWHHYQAVNKIQHVCNAKFELNAYLIQRKFLEDAGVKTMPGILSDKNIFLRSACEWELY
jgi:hypothetical protein